MKPDFEVIAYIRGGVECARVCSWGVEGARAAGRLLGVTPLQRPSRGPGPGAGGGAPVEISSDGPDT